VNSVDKADINLLIRYRYGHLKLKKIILITVMLLLALSGCKGTEKEVIISKAALQNMVDKKFPIENISALTEIKLFSPQIYFQDSSIGMTIQYSIILLIKEVGGTVSFKCNPVYKPENTSFYMSNFELTNVTINDVGSFNGKDNLMPLISMIVNGLFNDIPLYQLNPNDYKLNLTRMLLKSVSVRGDNLVLLLSL
jgi:hypothetical protein